MQLDFVDKSGTHRSLHARVASANQILQMEPEELGPHILRQLLKGTDANRFNFMLGVPGGPIANCFMEAWAWLEREGFIAHRTRTTCMD